MTRATTPYLNRPIRSEAEVCDALERMLGYFANAEHWTKEAIARDASGRPVKYDSEEAVCHCLYGAAHKFSHGDSGWFDQLAVRLRRALPSPHYYLVAPFNDAPETTIDNVRALIRTAMELS